MKLFTQQAAIADRLLALVTDQIIAARSSNNGSAILLATSNEITNTWPTAPLEPKMAAKARWF
jgi:hypothetical protein